MTRKDTILIAVVINAGLLAILFTTAVIYDTDKGIEKIELSTSLVDQKPLPKDPPSGMIASAASSKGDERSDDSLKYHASPSPQPVVVETEVLPPEPIAVQTNAPDEEDLTPREKDLLAQDNFVEVVVKRGDVLEKIAKAHKSKVAAIKKANNLQNEKLSIGQVLKVPVKQDIVLTDAPVKQPEKNEKSEANGSETVYHLVKSGDNPWKIAKQYNVKYEDILRLNHLDEEKARNLKIGDRIRVK